MKTFLDYYSKNGEFTMYYVTKRKPRRLCESDRCFFKLSKGGDGIDRVLIMRMPNGGGWMKRPIHTIACTHLGCFKIEELNTTVLRDTFMGVTVYLNKEDAEKELIK